MIQVTAFHSFQLFTSCVKGQTVGVTDKEKMEKASHAFGVNK